MNNASTAALASLLAVGAGTVSNKLIFGLTDKLPSLTWGQAGVAAAIGVGIALAINTLLGRPAMAV